MNRVVFMGRLTRDPELRSSSTEGIRIARFTLAIDRIRKNKNGEKEADFIPCLAFGTQADFAEKYLKKGIKICVSGRMQSGSYEKDGSTIYTLDCVCENMEFAESRKQEGTSGSSESGKQASATETDDGFVPLGYFQ